MNEELVKDLEAISHEIEDKSTTIGTIFDLEAFNVHYRRDYAARLAALGYRKVTECGRCKHSQETADKWERDNSPRLECLIIKQEIGFRWEPIPVHFHKNHYCSEGEPKEAIPFCPRCGVDMQKRKRNGVEGWACFDCGYTNDKEVPNA